MKRLLYGVFAALWASIGALPTQAAPPQEAAPASYELMINGESFLVEGNRMTTLHSKEKPGTVYNVAIRVAPTQQIRLENLEFSYDLPAQVERTARTARIHHELGYSMLITDLGRPLDAKGIEEGLKLLIESVTAAHQELKSRQSEVGKPYDRTFAHCTARGVSIHYRDARDFAHTSLLYILQGKTFSATCVIDYPDVDGAEVLPLIKKTFDSLDGIAKHN